MKIFTFFKKNKLLSVADLNPHLPAPSVVWLRIIYSAVILVLLMVFLSALLFWKILSQTASFADDSSASTASINGAKLKAVAETIKSRASSN